MNIILSTILSIASPSLPALEDLSLEEQVGQILMAHFHGACCNEESRILIEQLHIGGIIYYQWANELSSPEQIRTLSEGLYQQADQTKHAIFPLLAIDQEGGLVQRMSEGGATLFPGNGAIGAIGDPAIAKQYALAMGQELVDVGINFNLAPVVDVKGEKKSYMDVRSLGNEVEKVTSLAQALLEGFHEAGLLTSLKHYPGHGNVSLDSHEGLPLVTTSRREIEEKDLAPFLSLAPVADTIMTAHLLIPEIDPLSCATLSKPILNLLRDHHEVTFISDSLVMEGLLANCKTVQEAAIQALLAGCDILLLGGKQLLDSQTNFELSIQDVCDIHQAIVTAVQTGRIPQERVQEAAGRVLRLKEKSRALSHQSTKSEQGSANDHRSLAKQIAEKAIDGVWKKAKPLSLQNAIYLAPSILQKDFLDSSTLFYELKKGLNESMKDSIEKAEAIIFCSYNAWNDEEQQKVINSLLSQYPEKPFILLALRNTIDLELFPQVTCAIKAHGPTPLSLQAAQEWLKHSLEQ